MEKHLLKKSLVFAVIILFIFMSITPSSAYDSVKKSPTPTFDGNTLYVGGNGEGNYSKIQDAIDNASDGDTIFVFDDSSPYFENVVINKSINLTGENQETTIIDGSYRVAVISLIEMSFVNNLSVNGLTLRNGNYGIYLISNINTNSLLLQQKYAFSISIFNNTFIGNSIGIELRLNSKNVFLNNNIISNNGIGISLKYCSEGFFSNNIISNNSLGIMVDECLFGNIGIYENTIIKNNYGIKLYNSHKICIIENIINSNRNDGIYLFYSNQNNITGNNVYNNTNGINLSNSYYNSIDYNSVDENCFGIFLYISQSNYINKNVIKENTIGVCLLESSKNDLQGNTIKNNVYAISLVLFSKQNNIINNNIKNSSYRGFSLDGYCDENNIIENNFIKNKRHACFSNSYKNSWIGNYWDDWVGLKISLLKEFPKLIIGSSLTRLLNFDWFPAKEPYDIGM